MTKVNLQDLKSLRSETAAGLANCKKALIEAEGDYEKAKEILKTMGHALAAKKADREALEGFIATKSAVDTAVMLELNCETDFVARNEKFQECAEKILSLALTKKVETKDDLLASSIEGYASVADMIVEMIAIFKENIVLSRYKFLDLKGSGFAGVYVHNKYTENLGKIGIMSAIKSSGKKDVLSDVAKSVCIQVMSAEPSSVDIAGLDAKLLAKEKEKYEDNIKGKPPQIAEKIISGKLAKFYKSCVLLEQETYFDPDLVFKDYLARQAEKAGDKINVASFSIFHLGRQDG